MTTPQEAAMRKALEALEVAEHDLGYAGFTVAIDALHTALAQQPCKYGQTDCTANPMDCQCAIDAALAQQGGQQPVAWVWNPARIAWEKVRTFGHWQQGALYAFGPTQPEPLAAPAAAVAQREIKPVQFGGCPFCGKQSCVAGACRAPAPQPAQEQVGINGLTEAETSATMSVRGLSKVPQPAQCEQVDCEACKRKDSLLEMSLATIDRLRDAPGVFVDRSDAVNLARNIIENDSDDITRGGVVVLCNAVMRMDAALQSAQPVAQPFPEADLTGVSVCCGEYAKCGRPCTPRGRWQAEQAQPVAPLTDEQIEDIGFEMLYEVQRKDFIAFARAIEAAHGIKEVK